MEIRFGLGQAFKRGPAASLFSDYIQRISKFTRCQIGLLGERKPGTKVWVCDRGVGSKMLSSEDLAWNLEKLQDSGVKVLQIIIGPASGFSRKELEQLKPDLRWSLGPMTLPHELAAVVASEQIYRAFTILKSLPYHAAH